MQKIFEFIAKSALFAIPLSISIVGASQAADPVNGEKVFKRCSACHVVGPDAANRNGPQLNGVVGRAAGIVDGFKYGTGIIEARGEVGEDADSDGYLDVPEDYSGLVWNEETLLAYLENPRAYLIEFTGNKKAKARMVMRLNKEDQRQDVIAYLKTFALDGSEAPSQ